MIGTCTYVNNSVFIRIWCALLNLSKSLNEGLVEEMPLFGLHIIFPDTADQMEKDYVDVSSNGGTAEVINSSAYPELSHRFWTPSPYDPSLWLTEQQEFPCQDVRNTAGPCSSPSC